MCVCVFSWRFCTLSFASVHWCGILVRDFWFNKSDTEWWAQIMWWILAIRAYGCDSWHCNLILIYSVCLISLYVYVVLWLIFILRLCSVLEHSKQVVFHLQDACTLCGYSQPTNHFYHDDIAYTHAQCLCMRVCIQYIYNLPLTIMITIQFRFWRELQNIHQNTPISLPIFKFISHTYGK